MSIRLLWDGGQTVVERTPDNTMAVWVIDSHGTEVLFLEVPFDQTVIHYPPEDGALPLLRIGPALIPLGTDIALSLAQLETHEGALQ